MSNAASDKPTKPLELTEFQQAFDLPGLTRCEEPVLVHPGFPGPSSVSVWYARAKGSSPVQQVKARLDGKDVEPPPRLVHQPLRHAGRVRIDGLEAQKTYVVTLKLDGHQCAPIHVSTAPEQTTPAAFSFLAYSCLAPFSDEGKSAKLLRAVHSLSLLARRSRPPAGAAPAPAFALGMGDQVYVDDGVILKRLSQRAFLHGWKSQRRRYDASGTGNGAAEFFDALYEAYFRLQSYETSLRSIPHLMMWDDHDIRDGWGSQRDENATDEVENGEVMRWVAHMDAARSSFLAYQFLRNPPPSACPAFGSADGAEWTKLRDGLLAKGAPPTARPELCFNFQWGEAAHFFVLDLRSQRDARKVKPRVVSQDQINAVEDWLAAGGRERPPRLYVLVSPLPVTHETPNVFRRAIAAVYHAVFWFRKDDARDGWWSTSARAQRDELLALLHAHFSVHRGDRLLILSGDVHFAEILSLSLSEEKGRRVFGHEVISSGLAQSSFHGRVRSQRQGKASFRGETSGRAFDLESTGAGERFFGPHFAEIFVGEGSPPSVEVAFYPATRNKSDELVNTLTEVDALSKGPAQEERGRLVLQVGEGVPTTRLTFDRFMSSRSST